MEPKEWIRTWFLERGRPGASTLEPAQDFVACGVIDSFATIQLIAAVEEHFGVEFTDEDFQRPKFTTIDGLAAAVERQQKKPGGDEHGR